MAPEGSPLLALAQQGAEAANHFIAAKRSAENHRGEPSIGNRLDGRAKRARSETASSASDNHRLAHNDVHQQITQNHQQREYGHDRDDLHKVIDDRRRLRARSSNPPWCSQQEMSPHHGGAVFVLWLHHSGRLSGQKSSRLGTLTNMMASATQRNSSKSTTWLLRPQLEMIG
jgi:hypothetical protein